jgi:hypothetical protein
MDIDLSPRSANSGTVNGKDWPRWDPEGYAGTLKTYLKFVHAGYLGKQIDASDNTMKF